MYIVYNNNSELKIDVFRFTTTVRKDESDNIRKVFYLAELDIEQFKKPDLEISLEKSVYDKLPKEITKLQVINNDDECVVDIQDENSDSLFPEISRDIRENSDRLIFRFEVPLISATDNE